MMGKLSATGNRMSRRQAQSAGFAIRYSGLRARAQLLKQELIEAFADVVESGHYVLGPELSSFEEEFAEYVHSYSAIGVDSGTSALVLALRALGIGPGDEVVTVANSFIATAASIALVGARPVFVDIDDDLNLDASLLEATITSKTRAVIPVHVGGRPAQMPAIVDFAERYKLFVIEDAAQAIGARLHDQLVGSWGHVGCFSFHPLKNLHAFGDGGMITTADEAVRDRVKVLRNHGLRNRDECVCWSSNSRLDELQAALLRVQMRYLDLWTEERRRLASRYNTELAPYVQVPIEGPGEYCVYQTYLIRAPKRDQLQRHLQVHGVEALTHYATPVHLQPAAASLRYSPGDLPNTEAAAATILSLPLYPELGDSEQELIINLVKQFYSVHGEGVLR